MEKLPLKFFLWSQSWSLSQCYCFTVLPVLLFSPFYCDLHLYCYHRFTIVLVPLPSLLYRRLRSTIASILLSFPLYCRLRSIVVNVFLTPPFYCRPRSVVVPILLSIPFTVIPVFVAPILLRIVLKGTKW